MATTPRARTGEVTRARKLSPTRLVRLLRVRSISTARRVPGGTVTTVDGGAERTGADLTRRASTGAVTVLSGAGPRRAAAARPPPPPAGWVLGSSGTAR